VRASAGVTQDALVPELRHDVPAGGVHVGRDLLPSRQRLGAVEVRHVHVVGGALVLRRGAFGQDQAGAARGARPVVCGNLVIGDLVGRFRPRHGRHDNSVWQQQRLELERLEEYVRMGHERFLNRK